MNDTLGDELLRGAFTDTWRDNSYQSLPYRIGQPFPTTERRQMSLLRLRPPLYLAFFLASTSAHGGSIRYELPNLIGEHQYDGSQPSFLGRVAFVDTPFRFYSVTEARLVVEGHVAPGEARGDGIMREAVGFELLPSVASQPSFSNTFAIPVQPTSANFRLEQVYPYPFVPQTTPMPNPDGYPPISFYVQVSVGPTFSTDYPPLLTPPEPGELVFAEDGIIVDVPIIAEITNAYIVLSGPSIVPEPTSLVAAVIAFSALLITTTRLTRRCS